MERTWTDELRLHQQRAAKIEEDGVERWVQCPTSFIFWLVEVADGLRSTVYAAAESYLAELNASDTK